MSLYFSYLDGVEAALQKVASGMSMDQAREYVKNKAKEKRQDAFLASAGGIGTGIAEGLGNFTPVSGKVAVIPGAIAGYAGSKLKNVFDSPESMYVRNGDLTGRAIGGIAGTGLGAGLGAGIGSLVDDSGWGLGLGSLLGGYLGQAAGQTAGDAATEYSNRDVIRKAEIEQAKSKRKPN